MPGYATSCVLKMRGKKENMCPYLLVYVWMGSRTLLPLGRGTGRLGWEGDLALSQLIFCIFIF